MTNKTGLRVAPLLSLMTGLALVACASTGPEDDGSGGSGGSNTSGLGGSGPAGRVGRGGHGVAGSTSGAAGPRASPGPPAVRPVRRASPGPPAVRPVRRASPGPPAVRPATGVAGSTTGVAGTTGAAGSGRGGSTGLAGSGAGGSTTGAAGSSTPGTPSAENTGASCNATSGALKKNMKLPNPFAMHDGTIITTKAQWECRRNEILKDLEKYEIGPKQAPSRDGRGHPLRQDVEREGDDQRGLDHAHLDRVRQR